MALFQAAGDVCRLFATAATASDARLLLEALEEGVGGVLLRTEDAKEVRRAAMMICV